MKKSPLLYINNAVYLLLNIFNIIMSQCIIECAPSSPLNDLAAGANEQEAMEALLMLQGQINISEEHLSKVLPPGEQISSIREHFDPFLKDVKFSEEKDMHKKVHAEGRYMVHRDKFIPVQDDGDLKLLKDNQFLFDEYVEKLAHMLTGNLASTGFNMYLTALHKKIDGSLADKFHFWALDYLRSMTWQGTLTKLEQNLRKDGIHIFKAEWCAYCRLMLEKQAPQLFLPENRWLCIMHEQVLSQYENYLRIEGFDISGYPTVYFVKGNRKEQYTGQRTADAILTEFKKFCLL